MDQKTQSMKKKDLNWKKSESKQNPEVSMQYAVLPVSIDHANGNKQLAWFDPWSGKFWKFKN